MNNLEKWRKQRKNIAIENQDWILSVLKKMPFEEQSEWMNHLEFLSELKTTMGENHIDNIVDIIKENALDHNQFLKLESIFKKMKAIQESRIYEFAVVSHQ